MSPYNADTTAEQVALDCRSQIANKTILVTGVSPGGLGAQFAITIAKYEPACIILAARNISKVEATAREITAAAPAVRTWPIELDLGSQNQIREAAAKINALDENLDVIVNNAGIMACPYSKTVDGIESQFGINHIGHFLLTNLLLPKILAKKLPIRVVNVTSNGYRLGPIRFEDWNFDDGNTYNNWVAYGQSKSANMLFSVSLAHKLGKQGLVSVSLHPGVIQTQLGRDVSMDDFQELGQLDRKQGHRTYWGPFHFKTLSQGAATHVFAAFHPSLDLPEYNRSYLSDSQVVSPSEVRSWARDSIEAEQLWNLSEKIVDQKFEY
ncbi:hypothetical protein OIDMADRAFT_44862 [Oidiodendron maius Zn]|uniref:Uncharacterized protein n=1 Tax=Oidiodendron maius (strain Zn) TaxID=913774 RepID=A0A0C3CB44_OIDMZ|nr:hypothetical protein OIDMADRAFT_44862 [Oidiodendron maius Zn]